MITWIHKPISRHVKQLPISHVIFSINLTKTPFLVITKNHVILEVSLRENGTWIRDHVIKPYYLPFIQSVLELRREIMNETVEIVGKSRADQEMSKENGGWGMRSGCKLKGYQFFREIVMFFRKCHSFLVLKIWDEKNVHFLESTLLPRRWFQFWRKNGPECRVFSSGKYPVFDKIHLRVQ